MNSAGLLPLCSARHKRDWECSGICRDHPEGHGTVVSIGCGRNIISWLWFDASANRSLYSFFRGEM